MNRERLTVKQFCRTGIGLYRAIVLARWAMDCLYTLWPGGPPCLPPPRPGPPGPGPPPYLDGTSFSNRAILSTPKASLYEAAEKKANMQRDHTTLHPICFKTSYVHNCIVLSRGHIRDGWSESTSPLKEPRWLYFWVSGGVKKCVEEKNVRFRLNGWCSCCPPPNTKHLSFTRCLSQLSRTTYSD